MPCEMVQSAQGIPGKRCGAAHSRGKSKAIQRPKRGSGLNAAGQPLSTQLGLASECPSLHLSTPLNFHSMHTVGTLLDNVGPSQVVDGSDSDADADGEDDDEEYGQDVEENNILGHRDHEQLHLPTQMRPIRRHFSPPPMAPPNSQFTIPPSFLSWPIDPVQIQPSMIPTSSHFFQHDAPALNSHSLSLQQRPLLLQPADESPEAHLPQHHGFDPHMGHTLATSFPQQTRSHAPTLNPHSISSQQCPPLVRGADEYKDGIGFRSSDFVPTLPFHLLGPQMQLAVSNSRDSSLQRSLSRGRSLHHPYHVTIPMRPGETGPRGSTQVISSKPIRTISGSRKQTALPQAIPPQSTSAGPSINAVQMTVVSQKQLAASKYMIWEHMLKVNLMPESLLGNTLAQDSFVKIVGFPPDDKSLKYLIQSQSHLHTKLKDISTRALDWFGLHRPRSSLLTESAFKISRLAILRPGGTANFSDFLHIRSDNGTVGYYEHQALENLIHDSLFSSTGGKGIFPLDYNRTVFGPEITNSVVAMAAFFLDLYTKNHSNGFYIDIQLHALTYVPEYLAFQRHVEGVDNGAHGEPSKVRFHALKKSIYERGIALVNPNRF